ncbi:MAG: sulfatase-like hydrolase/transferase, partial [Verrucomicrobiota bacterium]
VDPPEVGGPVTITVTMSGGPADLNSLPLTLTFNGETIDIPNANVTRANRQTISFTVSLYGRDPGDYAVEAQYSAGPLRTGTHTIEENVLLLIVDDWGTDNSPLDNALPNAILPKMPNLADIAASGVRFTRAYAQPQCSPTRATILTGRQVFQHQVGDPQQANFFSAASGVDEMTIPEIFTAMSRPHEMLTVGKWHLGGNTTAYQSRGGWPEFYGINGGGVQSYTNWSKNSNGSVTTSMTYSTTDQVNHTVQFIGDSVAEGKPWFSWVAFNAPHDPFEDPPANLAPEGGYSAQAPGENESGWFYRKMLEALDTEIGRLLEVVDPAQTNIIVIGDNGSPGSKVQAPYDQAHSKGSLYNGGTHVPLLVSGPSVTLSAGSTSDKLVHCIDLFSTILEMAGVDESVVPGLAAMNVQSTSLVPILQGTDTEDRAMVAERGGDNWGRAIIVDDYPGYKLIIFGNPTSTADTPRFEFYDIANDVNEQTRLAHDPDEPFEIDLTELTNLGGDALAAYNACVAKDQALGGGYSTPASDYDTIYIELPDTGVTPVVPGLATDVTSVTVDGTPAIVVAREDSGSSLSDESDDQTDRYWVKVRMSPANGGPYTSAEVVFPNTGPGVARVYQSINSLLVNPNP